jgi:hypothetical protein
LNKTNNIDKIILPKRNITSLAYPKINKAMAINNSMSHEPASTTEATKRVVQIFDANYEKADPQAVGSQWTTP